MAEEKRKRKRKERKERKEKMLSPKCILDLPFYITWDIQVIHNILILLVFSTKAWELVFKNLKNQLERKITFPQDDAYNGDDLPSLFCLTDENLVLVLSRPTLFGYTLDGTLLFRVRFIHDNKFLVSNPQSPNFTFTFGGIEEKTPFTVETLDMRKPNPSFHITRKRYIKSPPHSYEPLGWYVVQGIDDKFGIFGFGEDHLYWWNERGENPEVIFSPVSDQITSSDAIFYSPKNGLVLSGCDCLTSYSFSQTPTVHWKFNGRWT